MRISDWSSDVCSSDLSDEESIRQFYRFVQDRHGRLDILHNNAAASQGEEILRDMAIEHMDAAVWDRAFIVNTRGTMLMIKHAIPMMREAGGGSIINTSSGARSEEHTSELQSLMRTSYAA